MPELILKEFRIVPPLNESTKIEFKRLSSIIVSKDKADSSELISISSGTMSGRICGIGCN